jgi:hypothetical protein
LPSTGYALARGAFRVGFPVTTGLARHTCCELPFPPITVLNATPHTALVSSHYVEHDSR